MSIPESLKGLASGYVSSAIELVFKSDFVITIHLLYSSSILNYTFVLTGYFRLEMLAPEGFI